LEKSGSATVDDELEGVGHVPFVGEHHRIAVGIMVGLADVQASPR